MWDDLLKSNFGIEDWNMYYFKHSSYIHKISTAIKHLYEWSCQTAHLSVRLSHLFHNVLLILSSWNFNYNSRNDIHAKGQVCPSNFKVTVDKKSPILTQIQCFWTITPIWIRQWMWCEIMHKAWSNIGEVPYSLFKSSVKLQVTLAGKI